MRIVALLALGLLAFSVHASTEEIAELGTGLDKMADEPDMADDTSDHEDYDDEHDFEDEDYDEDLGEGEGRGGGQQGFLSTEGSFTLSGGAAGAGEELDE